VRETEVMGVTEVEEVPEGVVVEVVEVLRYSFRG